MVNPVQRFNRFLHHLCLRSRGELHVQLLRCSTDSQSVLSLAANGDTGVVPSKKEHWKACAGDNMEDIFSWNANDRKAADGALKSSAVSNNTIIRQNDLPMPAALNNQTAGDVWKDIQTQSTTNVVEHDQHYTQRQRQFPLQQKPATFGEMSREDFVSRSAVVTDDPNTISRTADSSSFYPLASAASMPNNFSSAVDAFPSFPQDWIIRPCLFQPQQSMQQSGAVAAAKGSFQPPSLMLASGGSIYDDGDNAALGPDGFASTLALPTTFSDYSLINSKRCLSEAGAEKVMERRQKRMIKNRESAARSRARKQAYTVKLETEITALKEENARLRKQWVLQMLKTPPAESTCMENSKLQVPKKTQST